MRRAMVGAVLLVGLLVTASPSHAAGAIDFVPADPLTISANQLSSVDVAIGSVVNAPIEVLVEAMPAPCPGGGGNPADEFTFGADQGRIEPLGIRVFRIKGTAPRRSQ